LEDILHNPVYHALSTGDAYAAIGTDDIKYFDEKVSPFVGIRDHDMDGFAALHAMLPEGRRILYAIPHEMPEPEGWETKAVIQGLQFVYTSVQQPSMPALIPEPLTTAHVEEMIALTALTRPGPFDQRTIEFGHYHGFFVEGKLVSMTGQRLHPGGYTEISAVCTHPDHVGKGYAAALLQHQLRLILTQGKKPFLHVRGDNSRAIALYERLGFEVSRPMIFYFMKRKA
jgi:GNAT superfamily N-acetyltransferase